VTYDKVSILDEEAAEGVEEAEEVDG